MLTTLMKLIENMQSMGDSIKDRQTKISVSEVWHLWELVTARYDVIEATQILRNFASDTDFK